MSGSPYPSCTMGPSRGANRELSKPWVPVAGLPSTSTHPPTFPPHLHVFLMGFGEWGSHDSSELLLP